LGAARAPRDFCSRSECTTYTKLPSDEVAMAPGSSTGIVSITVFGVLATSTTEIASTWPT
jgi:hypothetical protein